MANQDWTDTDTAVVSDGGSWGTPSRTSTDSAVLTESEYLNKGYWEFEALFEVQVLTALYDVKVLGVEDG